MCEGFSKHIVEENTKRSKSQMSSNLIEKIVKEAVDLGELQEIIPSTMGEPLLYKNFDVFIDLCKKITLNSI